MTIIITGIGGMLGSCVAQYLNKVAPGESVIGVDWLGKGNKWKNLRGCQNLIDVITPSNDHGTTINLIKQMKKAAVVHCGAVTSTTESDADLLLNMNYILTKEIIKACVETGNRLIYLSSASTYGDSSDFSDKISNVPKLYPLNKYAFSKQMVDIWSIRHKAFDAGVVGLKAFNLFGPNEIGHKGEQASLISKIIKRYVFEKENRVCLFNEEPTVHRGMSIRDFVYVKDVCEVICFFLDQGCEVGGLFNVGTGRGRTMLEVVKSIEQATGKPFNISYVPIPDEIKPSYQYRTEADLSSLRRIGYDQPFMSLESAVVEFYNSHWVSGNSGYWK